MINKSLPLRLMHKLTFILTTISMLLFFSETSIAGAKTDIEINKEAPSQTETSEPSATDDNKPRGQLLYENHCGECHESSVHKRNPRKADSISKIKYWVTRWNKELKLNWSDADITEVAQYLNTRYYHFKN